MHTTLPPPKQALPERAYLENQFVYLVLSQRARGLSVGINLNPDKQCNFDCVYCEVDRSCANSAARVDVPKLAAELEHMLMVIQDNRTRELPGFESVPSDLLKLKEVALSGDGEPTMCPEFEEVIQTVLHVRGKELIPFFKVVLITNGSGLHLPAVRRGLQLFTSKDEVWVKLDVGREQDFQRINCPKDVCLEHVLKNILELGRQRPIVIQSLFPAVNGQGPAENEIAEYIERLKALKNAGARISLVQIYSVHRTAVRKECTHLPLRELTAIARRVRQAGLPAEVF